MSSLFIDELQKRNLIFDTTASIDELHQLFDESKNSVKFYIGFDPTADSLHVGSLQQLIIMNLAKKFGHEPIALIGGATASIGDPSFKDSMRPVISKDTIEINQNSISSQIKSIVDIDVVNNIEWTRDINFLDFLRDFGKHFSVNKMLSFSSVKDRLSREDCGLSVLEFSYSMLQAFDFFHLNEQHNVVVQMGGADQWSNIIQGIDLVHKINGKKVVGITNPLVLKSDGTKMGKTVSGAVWLNKQKTSVFDFFQFWRNIDDAELPVLMKRFLGMDVDLDHINESKKLFALEMVEFVHGKEEKDNLEKSLSLGKAATTMSLSIKDANTIFDVVMLSGLFSSKSEVRRMIKNKERLLVNNVKIEDETLIQDIINVNDVFLIEKGKKSKVNITIEE